jgi:hypothetical protein
VFPVKYGLNSYLVFESVFVCSIYFIYTVILLTADSQSKPLLQDEMPHNFFYSHRRDPTSNEFGMCFTLQRGNFFSNNKHFE